MIGFCYCFRLNFFHVVIYEAVNGRTFSYLFSYAIMIIMAVVKMNYSSLFIDPKKRFGVSFIR